MKDLNNLIEQFYQIYNKSDSKPNIFFAPGRVNLIGEHTDYNGGYVFPCALNYGTYLLIRETQDETIRFASTNMEFTAKISISGLGEKQGKEWVNYPMGVIDQLIKLGIQPKGSELLYSGDIPNGAGLSSSASIEVVTAYALNKLWNANIPKIDLIKLSQKAENEFVGMNCGIMDQFAVGVGQKDSALFLNCDTLDYENVPLVLKNYKLVISNTNKRRELADSKYNERRSECDKAVEYLNEKKKIRNLSELSLEEFEEIKSAIPDEIIRSRARHVISENDRVLRAIPALKNGNLDLFGQLMNESHDSLKTDYEVTGFELDTMAEEAQKLSGVIGSRMTGAGFGGCTVSLVDQDQIDGFIDKLGKTYSEKTNLQADFYVADVGNGVCELFL
ncbi:MAG: galactokinase [Bacteroidales bacterium]|nr:galactokinase [Bacteroidales bacterium]